MKPPAVAILAARLIRAYRSLSPYSAASLAAELCAIERAQHRHAERQCSGEDGGYVKPTRKLLAGVTLCGVEHDPEAEERAGQCIERRITAWHRRVVELTGRSGVLYREPTDGRDGIPPRLALAPDQSDAVVDVHGDPRGAVLKLRLPGEAEAVAV